MVLDKTSRNLPKLLDARATRLGNVASGLGKTRISEDVKAAQAAAEHGERAYQGQFAEGGIIASGYQDHGVGINQMSLDAVSLVGYAYGPWVYNLAATTDRNLVAVGAPVNQDAISLAGDLNIPTAARPLYRPQNSFQIGQPQVYSIYAYLDFAASVTLRVVEADTLADAAAGTGTATLLATGVAVAGAPGALLRPRVEFTPSKPYLRFEHQLTRTSGAAGALPTVYFHNPMLEQVQTGQHQASKFVTPKAGRGGVPANAIEGDALLQHRAGLRISRNGTVSVRVSAGSAYVPGLGRVVNLAADQNIGSLGGVINTAQRFHYLYLTEDAAGNGLAEFSQTAPAAPYAGTARTKSADTKRRYLGAVQTMTDSTLRDFEKALDQNFYQDAAGSRIALSAGAATVGTDIDCSWVLPPHVRLIYINFKLAYISSGGASYLSRPGGPSPGANQGIYELAVTANARQNTVSGPILTDVNQTLRYANNVAGMEARVEIVGWVDQS